MKNYQKNKIEAIFRDPRMRDFRRKDYDSLFDMVKDVIQEGKSIHFQTLAHHLSFEDALYLPSLKSIEENGTEIKKILELILLILGNLYEYFERQINGITEEVAWNIKRSYAHFSIPDILIFCQNCKQKKYSNSFQHVTVRGITPEFIELWLKEYELERKEFIRGQFSILEKRCLAKEKSQPAIQLLENAFFDFDVQNRRGNEYKAEDELRRLAKEEVIRVEKELKKKYVSEENKRFQNEEAYLNYFFIQRKDELLNEFRKNDPRKIIQKSLSEVVQEKNIKNVEGLKHAFPNFIVKVKGLSSYRNRLTNRLVENFELDWHNQKKRIIKGEIPFMTHGCYLRLRAFCWVKKYCLPLLNKNAAK